MPATEILVFREANGRIPMEDWLDFLPTKARAKCLHYMRLLAASGHELRRPIADILRDEIYELRPSHRGGAVPHSVFLPGSGRGGAFARDHETAEGSGRGNSPCGGTQAARARRSATVFLQVGSQGGLICLQCADSSPTRSSIFGIVTWATIRSAFRNTKSAGRISRSRN